jgi:hypothetical protein
LKLLLLFGDEPLKFFYLLAKCPFGFLPRVTLVDRPLDIDGTDLYI